METAPGKTAGNGPSGNRGNDPRWDQVGVIPGGNMEKRPRGERGIDPSWNGKMAQGEWGEVSQGETDGTVPGEN